MSQHYYTVKAGADLTGKEGYAVKLTAGKATLCNAATDKPVGVLRQGAQSGEDVAIALPGATVPVKLSGAVKAYQHIEVAADGRGAPSSYIATRVLFAQALESGVAGDLIAALTLPPVICS